MGRKRIYKELLITRSIALTLEEIKKIDDIKEKYGISRNAQIRKALELYFASLEK